MGVHIRGSLPSPFFLEFLDEALDGGPREGLRLAALTVVHKRVHDRRGRVGRRRHLSISRQKPRVLKFLG